MVLEVSRIRPEGSSGSLRCWLTYAEARSAHSAGIMHEIRACSTRRLVFLISDKDELLNTKAGAIRNHFELMGKFIKVYSPQSSRQSFFSASPLGH